MNSNANATVTANANVNNANENINANVNANHALFKFASGVLVSKEKTWFKDSDCN